MDSLLLTDLPPEFLNMMIASTNTQEYEKYLQETMSLQDEQLELQDQLLHELWMRLQESADEQLGDLAPLSPIQLERVGLDLNGVTPEMDSLVNDDLMRVDMPCTARDASQQSDH